MSGPSLTAESDPSGRGDDTVLESLSINLIQLLIRVQLMLCNFVSIKFLNSLQDYLRALDLDSFYGSPLPLFLVGLSINSEE